MNNANHAFRSHLMQQFAAQARNQSRPPLALMSLISEESDSPLYTATTAESSPSRGRQQHSCLHTSHIAPTMTLPRMSNTNSLVLPHHRAMRLQPIAPRFSSAAARIPDGEGENDEASTTVDDFQPNLSLLFQNMLQTRRSTSRFLPYSSSSSSSSLWSSLSSSRLPSTAVTEEGEEEDEAKLLQQEQLYWKQVLERAVMCGCQAPNHKRTEPFTFKRMIAPSPATERLADIFYHVTLRKQQQQQQQSAAANTINQQQQSASATISVEEMENTAQRKREKWSQIPAFLVTIVSSPSSSSDNFDDTLASSSAEHVDFDEERMNEYLYEPLPYSPPLTERALEDYASACAATQNVLLSLHSEDVASKWVTGPVIRTRAFRNLVLGHEHSATSQGSPGVSSNHHRHYQNNDRIVALIPVGHYFPTSSSSPQQGEKTSLNQQQQRGDESVPSSSSSSIMQQQHQLYHHGHRRRYKRPMHGNLLVDL